MEKDRLYGNCHCGAVQFSIPRSLDTSAVRRCDCSLCKRRGAVMLACPIEDVKIETAVNIWSITSGIQKLPRTTFAQSVGL